MLFALFLVLTPVKMYSVITESMSENMFAKILLIDSPHKSDCPVIVFGCLSKFCEFHQVFDGHFLNALMTFPLSIVIDVH